MVWHSRTHAPPHIQGIDGPKKLEDFLMPERSNSRLRKCLSSMQTNFQAEALGCSNKPPRKSFFVYLKEENGLKDINLNTIPGG
jgi:hypothetical protein